MVFEHTVGFSLRGLDFAKSTLCLAACVNLLVHVYARQPAYRLTSSHSCVTSCRVLDSDTTRVSVVSYEIRVTRLVLDTLYGTVCCSVKF